MTKRDKCLNKLQRELGYVFAEPALLREATTHRSSNERSNERLEFLGDAVVGLIVGDMLYKAFPDDEEGVLSKKRSLLVRTDSLASIAESLHIGECLALGNGEDMCGGRQKEHILEDALEAVLGAVFSEGGYHAARDVIESLFRDRIEAVNLTESELLDFKSLLQEKVQAIVPSTKLTYCTVCVEGPPHAPQFTIELRINDAPVSTGMGSSKKESAQAAAQVALASFDRLVLPLLHTEKHHE